MTTHSTSSLQFRRAGQYDVPALCKFFRLCLRAAYKDIMTQKQLEQASGWATTLLTLSTFAGARSNRILQIAEYGGEIVGCAAATREIEGRIVLNMLYVHPERQRSGIGSQMIEQVTTNWKDTTEIRLEVLKRNLGAIGFYERLGFDKYGETAHATGMRDVPAIYMDRRVEPANALQKARAVGRPSLG